MNHLRTISRASFLFTFLFAALHVSAQVDANANTWLGLTYGPVSDWHHPANWSKGHVPTEIETVIIPDLSNKGKTYYPIIRFDATAGNISVHPQAKLTILSEGTLLLENVATNGSALIGNIDNKGAIIYGFDSFDGNEKNPSLLSKTNDNP